MEENRNTWEFKPNTSTIKYLSQIYENNYDTRGSPRPDHDVPGLVFPN